MTLNIGTAVADIFTGGAISQARNQVNRATGGTLDIYQIGIMNPFGRKQESEADYLGLIFSSLSGYDIRESVKLWKEWQKRIKEKNLLLF